LSQVLVKARDRDLANDRLDLVPVMLEIVRWSAKHDPQTAAPPDFVAEVKRNREGVERMVRSQFGRPFGDRAEPRDPKDSSRT
jgi:hypothetical protein